MQELEPGQYVRATAGGTRYVGGIDLNFYVAHPNHYLNLRYWCSLAFCSVDLRSTAAVGDRRYNKLRHYPICLPWRAML